jgi:hypothetical protein
MIFSSTPPALSLIISFENSLSFVVAIVILGVMKKMGG